MKKFSILIIILCSFLIPNNEHIRQNSILFCLKPNVPKLVITRNNNNISVNHFEINKILISFPLLIIYLIGPIGLILYWVIRIFYAKRISLYD